MKNIFNRSAAHFFRLFSHPQSRMAALMGLFLFFLAGYQIMGIVRWIRPQLLFGDRFRVAIYGSPKDLNSVGDIDRSQKPSLLLRLNHLDFHDSNRLVLKEVGDTGFRENFWLEATGEFEVDQESPMEWQVASDDGFQLYIDEKLVLEFAGVRDRAVDAGIINISPGRHQFRLVYTQRFGKVSLEVKYRLLNGANQQMAFAGAGENGGHLRWLRLR